MRKNPPKRKPPRKDTCHNIPSFEMRIDPTTGKSKLCCPGSDEAVTMADVQAAIDAAQREPRGKNRRRRPNR